MNPTWRVHALDRKSLVDFLPLDVVSRLLAVDKSETALSDQIRIELLHRYGGVWADATAMCMRPLDDWLPATMPNGFFAFSKPAPERMIASWFLASEKGGYIVKRWRDATAQHWAERSEEPNYFWFHQLFTDRYNADEQFRLLWDGTPQRTAQHEGHFSPEDKRLTQSVTSEQIQLLAHPPAPVFKLTHKLSALKERNAFLDYICDWEAQKVEGAEHGDNAEPRRKVLVGWYGSFEGHGTVGDLRSLEAVVTHLAANGHSVSHSTAAEIAVAGVARVDWRRTRPTEFDAVLFVCGPILKSHPQTNEFFKHFRGAPLGGLGVSLLPAKHAEHFNPFSFVLAREGRPDVFGDVAICAPFPTPERSPASSRKIGVALRGPQHEYGIDLCAWKETEAVAMRLAEAALAHQSGDIALIENHLARAGSSADEIEAQYAQCDLIITSRFHGAIEALRNSVPYVAIDQIRGGAKVKALLSRLPWPHVYTIDELAPSQLEEVCASLVAQKPLDSLIHTRQWATREANRTLMHLDSWLDTLPSQHP